MLKTVAVAVKASASKKASSSKGGRYYRCYRTPDPVATLTLGDSRNKPDITTHYSAVELRELLDAVEKKVDRGVNQTPTLTVVRRTQNAVVGKMSENRKGLAANSR